MRSFRRVQSLSSQTLGVVYALKGLSITRTGDRSPCELLYPSKMNCTLVLTVRFVLKVVWCKIWIEKWMVPDFSWNQLCTGYSWKIVDFESILYRRIIHFCNLKMSEKTKNLWSWKADRRREKTFRINAFKNVPAKARRHLKKKWLFQYLDYQCLP